MNKEVAYKVQSSSRFYMNCNLAVYPDGSALEIYFYICCANHFTNPNNIYLLRIPKLSQAWGCFGWTQTVRFTKLNFVFLLNK